MSNRDFCADVCVIFDSVIQAKAVYASPVEKPLPEHESIIRVKSYWLKLPLTVSDQHTTHGILEGFIEPGGLVPWWL